MRRISSRLALASGLLLCTFLAYLPALRGGFVWDDNEQFISVPLMTAPDGLKRIWSGMETLQYYPVTFSAFWLERHLWGLDPRGYHLLNAALHSVNALLLGGAMQLLSLEGGWLAAAIFALHPVNVESVAWATELKNVLSGLFYLLALIGYLRFLDTRSRKLYLSSLALFLLALLSKTSTIMLPVVLLLAHAWKKRTSARESLLQLAPFFALSGLIAGVTIYYERIMGAQGSEWSLGFPQRALLACRSVWFYAGKLLFPYPLSFIYPRWSIDPSKAVTYIPAAALFLAAYAAWRNRARWGRPILFAFGYFVVCLFPVLGFIDFFFMRFSFVADHFQYLASMGPIVLAAAFAARLTKNWSGAVRRSASGVLLLALGVLTWRQGHAYANEDALWRDTLAKNPDAWVAHYNMGIYAGARGEDPEAIAQYREALRIRPEDGDAHNNLALELMRQKKLDEAIAEFRRSLRSKPYAVVHSNLGTAFFKKDEKNRALAEFEQAARMEPDNPDYLMRLGSLLSVMRRPRQALAYFDRTLAVDPSNAQARLDKAVALTSLGRRDEALAALEAALSANPPLPAEFQVLLTALLADRGRTLISESAVHRKAGDALYSKGLLDQAGREYRLAVVLNPAGAEAFANLADVFAAEGELDAAVVLYGKALTIDPRDIAARCALGNAFLKQGSVLEAVREFKLILTIDLHNARAREGLLRIQETARRGAPMTA